MNHVSPRRLLIAVLLFAVLALRLMSATVQEGLALPAPAVDMPAGDAASQVAVFAGGCFWGVQGVFQHVKGVSNALSGYAGGAKSTAIYELTNDGTTGHAESVQVTFDPRQVTYGQLLQVFFSVAHDPTQLNRQGPDTGTQYRSTIFPANAEQAAVAKAYIAQLDGAKMFKRRIVTTIEMGRTFYPAEKYHQDFLVRNPTYPYIVYNDLPKIENLKRLLPAMYRAVPVLVSDTRSPDRINPMIALHERGLPVFGVTHPTIVAGRGSTSTPLPSLVDAARDTVAYRFSDFAYDNYSSATADRFRGYMEAMLAAGGSAREHAFISKVPIIHTDPAVATARIVEQLNAGHVGVMLQEVESADEVRAGLAAMRFAAKGGTRPNEGVGLAAAYWKLTEAEYREKADPWPLNPKGELVLWAIVESRKGIANIREIAQVPGLTVIVVGAGTLGGVFSTTGADGQRVRDQAGFDAGVSAILSACKEFKVACSHPANNPKEIEDLMARGFTVFTMQRRDPAAFDAIAAGRKISGRR